MKRHVEIFILFALVIARVQIDNLADIVALPQRFEDIQRLTSGWGEWVTRLDHPSIDPISMMLIATAFALLGIYMVVDLLPSDKISSKINHRLKLILIYGLIALLVFGKSLLLMNLRHLRGPASYAHDGGIIQTEVTIDYFLNGLNPYVEDYVDTPMAEWGFSEYRTALYHFPYLPWVFIFATPIYQMSHFFLGWFDMRMVYLLLFALTLILVQTLFQPSREQLIALMIIGLNPILSVSLIFGENDPFILAWIVLGLWLVRWKRLSPSKRFLFGSGAIGLACASKPTAWFLGPFWLLYLLHDQEIQIRDWKALLITTFKRAWTLPVTMLLIVGPWFVWNPDAMIDDVWRWSAGQGETGYQIWGWGASNYILAGGWVADRFEYWPFIIPEFIVAVPLLCFLLYRQRHQNTMGTMLHHYVIFLFAFAYVSRFLQPNYLGYMSSLLGLAIMLPMNHPQKSKEFHNKLR